ncbi:uncharacterized protein ACA1_034150 [Acanthamoeba castellanii str. Neff]|uniref:Uncharacterized protein n=1 Tax=Acanthamoeba castellanii (strain ATCC 30010 / Neff) TaxID=1257118 RepID=L8GU50_ACACF|nr:uncharacterized protein ACA1_034150 [Acanthamoeba castellanii str. Neff]ELR16477.1 hypothetical protein ACA1_034150 [Acanthamoeba castellanii str. Neff]
MGPLWRGTRKRDWTTPAASSLCTIPLHFFLLGCGLYLVYFASAQLHPTAIETCQLAPYTRHLNPDNVELQEGGPWLPKGIREFLFFWEFRLVLGAIWAALLYFSPNKAGLVGSMVLVVGGYFVALTAVEELKMRSDDFECHTTHANGISGHAFYAVWALCALYYYYMHLIHEIAAKPALRWKKAKMSGQRSETFNFSSPSSHISSASVLPPVESAGSAVEQPDELDALRRELTSIEEIKPHAWEWIGFALGLVVAVSLSIQLVYTYRYGYHSPRQMLLAASLGAFYSSLSSLLSQVIMLALRSAPTNKNKHE